MDQCFLTKLTVGKSPFQRFSGGGGGVRFVSWENERKSTLKPKHWSEFSELLLSKLENCLLTESL